MGGRNKAFPPEQTMWLDGTPNSMQNGMLPDGTYPQGMMSGGMYPQEIMPAGMYPQSIPLSMP